MMRIERGKLLRGAPYLVYGLLFVAGVIAALVGDKGYLDLRRLRAERTRTVEPSRRRKRCAQPARVLAALPHTSGARPRAYHTNTRHHRTIPFAMPYTTT